MPKLKTCKGVAKRFKFTATGKIKRSKACGSHLLSKKSSRQKRRLRHPDMVHPRDAKIIKRTLPYG